MNSSLEKAYHLNSPRANSLFSFFNIIYLNTWILFLLISTNPKIVHWFTIPTFLCGVVIAKDALSWIKGDYDLFDPKGIIGSFGWHFFYLAPLLFIYWDVGMKYVNNPTDWRPWVGFLSILNLLALIFYQSFERLGFNSFTPGKKFFWKVNPNKVLLWFLLFLGIAILTQIYYLLRVGGISGILNLTAIRKQTGISGISGVGVLEIIGNSSPILLMIIITLFKVHFRRQPSWLSIIFLTAILGIIQFFLGGLRGSRSATIWSLFWIIGIIHYYLRPLTFRFIFVLIIALMPFMYLYGFYKGSSKVNGVEAIHRLAQGASFNELEEVTGRSFKEMVVADLARVDTQSFELYRLANDSDYELRWGRTYISSALSYIPGWIWKGRPLEPEKVVAGTELFHGQDSYVPGDKFRNSQKVYGLGGEALLNFGIPAFPIPFAFWGFLIGRYRRSMLQWLPGDFRLYFAPLFTLLFLISLIGDFYNLLGFLITKCLIPVFLFLFSLVFSGHKIPLEESSK